MNLRNSILLLLFSALLSACFDNTQKKKYSITTYFTSFDSSSNSMGNEGKKFKYSRFKELLIEIQEKTMEEQKNILNDQFEKWRGNLEQVDDILVIGIRV